MTTLSLAPAPWRLTGSAHILLLWFDRRFAQHCCRDHPELRKRALGGPGAVMAVDYAATDVGPYRELLIVPGRFRIGGRKRFAVTDIMVSTNVSVDNGRRNWGLPKTLASFRTEDHGHRRRFEVTRESDLVARLDFNHYGPALPVTTRLAPKAWHSLLQPWHNRWYDTTVQASGRVRPTRLQRATVNGDIFPDFTRQRRLICLHVARFNMSFLPAAVD